LRYYDGYISNRNEPLGSQRTECPSHTGLPGLGRARQTLWLRLSSSFAGFPTSQQPIGGKTTFEGLNQWLEWLKYFGISGLFCRLKGSNTVGEVHSGAVATYLRLTSQLSPAQDVSSQDRGSTPTR
jgi:hypothetical protein